MTVYSQQIFAVISLLIVLFLAVFSRFAFGKRNSAKKENAEQADTGAGNDTESDKSSSQ